MTEDAKSLPDDYHNLQPYLIFANCKEAIAFYARVFGATERLHMDDGKGRTTHAELQLGDSILMMADEHPEIGAFSPGHFGGSPIALMLYVEQCDSTYQAALAAGATSLREPANQPYGDRMAGVLDPFGYKWWIAHPSPKHERPRRRPSKDSLIERASPLSLNAMAHVSINSGNGAANGPSLLLRGLRKAFADVVAVNGLDLEVARGECFGLLGPNGAGKTTTIEICEGLTDPDSGTVELLGLNWRSNADELRQRIGIQLQETQFPDKLTVEETIRLFRSFFKRGISVEESIKTAQLEEKRNSRVGGLSGGQKQRLAMACALVGDPELLFLDEPTTGLDPQARRHLWDLVDELKKAGRTIILTTHYMDEAERLSDRVAIMDHGKIIALGTPQQLIASVGGEHVVEFAVSGQAAVDTTALLAIPGIQSHRVDAGLHQLSVSELHIAVPRIFADLAAQGLHLSEFRTHSASLEDVFVGLTGRNLRDE